MSATGVADSRRSITRASLPALVGCLLLTAWVQRHALVAFFSLDDLVHLEQAVGLRPTLPNPFRLLSQIVYFRVMTWLFGPAPGPFHLVSLVVHLTNVVLVFLFVRSAGASRTVSGLCASCFGVFPLFFPVLSSAIGVNDELALTFTLVTLILAQGGGTGAIVLASTSFLIALLCKESILAMPLMVLALRKPGERLRVALPLLVTAAVFGALRLALAPQGPGPYAAGFGAHVFHNLMTYAAWGVNLTRPIPDLVTSYDPSAWRVGAWVYGVLIVACVVPHRARSLVRLGVAWWVLALLPVLPLRFQTYRQYLYPAIPGLALAFASLAVSAVTRLAQTINPRDATLPAPHGAARWIVTAVMATCALAYGVRSEHLISERLRARVPGTQLALDPELRRQEVAQRALTSLADALGRIPAPAKVAIFAPEGTGRVFGARSGREYARTSPRGRPRDLLEESLDHGGAVQLFFPHVDSIVFIDRWAAQYRDYELLLPIRDGYLLGVGRGPQGHAAAARWMFEQRWYPQVRDYLQSVIAAYPPNPSLRLAYASALFKCGDRALGLAQLRVIVRETPDDPAADAARAVLAGEALRTPPVVGRESR